MLGFQPYETFQLLIETGGIDRANTLLVAACDAFARRPRPSPVDIEQFEALVTRLFPTAAPAARARAAQTLGRADTLSPKLEALVVEHIGEQLPEFAASAAHLSEATLLGLLARGDTMLASAVARRGDLSNVVIARLFQMNSRRVYRSLALNGAIKAKGPYLSALARAAEMDHLVAATLADREDFDTALLAPAFFDLSEENRLRVISAFAERHTPDAPIKRTLEQLSVATGELTQALMKLFSQNRRPEVTRLIVQVTGLDELRCGQIAHDTSGAALFVVIRAFGCSAQEGLKVLIHATSHDEDRSQFLKDFARMFETVSADAMAFLLSAWRGDVNLLDLSRPEYLPFTQRRGSAAASTQRRPINEALEALEKLDTRRAG